MKKDLSHQAYPKNVTVVGARQEEEVNFMTVAWSTYLSHDPLLFGVSIAPERYTHDLIENSEEFNCNFLPFSEIRKIHAIGRVSGKECDKVDELDLEVEAGKSIETPNLTKAYAVIECELEKMTKAGDHTFFVGEIVDAINRENSFKENSILDINKESPALYLGKNTYTTTGDKQEKI